MPVVNVILWIHRGGQVAGAQLLRDLLEENGFTTRLIITSRDMPTEAYRADCNVFSSEISPLWLPLAPKNVLIPNQEQDVRQSFGRMHPTRFSETQDQLSYLRLLDKLLVKTRHAQRVYQEHGLNCAYIGFTCRDRVVPNVGHDAEPGVTPGFGRNPLPPSVLRGRAGEGAAESAAPIGTDPLATLPRSTEGEKMPKGQPALQATAMDAPEPWLCVIGDSYANKDVAPVLRVWRRNPQFPRLLVCLYNIPPGLRPLLVDMPNVTYRRERLADDELRRLQNNCAVHICPSMMEGWGHAIVESMSTGALLLTLGAPPMDEHVDESRGVLFGYRDLRPHAFGFKYTIDEASLEDAVRRAVGLSEADRRERGRRAREYFLETDRHFRAAFIAEMKSIVGAAYPATFADAVISREPSTGAASLSNGPTAAAAPASVLVEISTGELLDKISILRIKRLRLREPAALANVVRELAALEAARDRQLPASPELKSLASELESVNAALWQTEDDLRVCEQNGAFGPDFVALARSVYRLNDRRAALKRRVNSAAGSRLVEEKLHPAYGAGGRPGGVIQKLLREALAHQRAGKIESAEKCFRKVLVHDPEQADALHLLGLLLHQRGEDVAAMDSIHRALSVRPGTAEFHNSLGMLLGSANRHAEAEVSFRRARELRAQFPEAVMNLATALMHQGKIDESIETHLQSISLQPQSPEAHYNYADALGKQEQIERSAEEYLRAIELRPNFPPAFNNLGICRRQLAQPDLARAAFERAIELQPDFASAHWNRGMLLLLEGDWAQGWKEYAWRWQLKEFMEFATRFKNDKWEGGDLNGRTILLYAEQGLGDTLQFIRYAPLLARRGAKVIVESQPGLTKLLKSVEGVERILARGETLPSFDVYAPLLDLPGLFGMNLDNLPAKTPYLHADPHLVADWAQRLRTLPGRLRVGLSWEGSRVPDPLRTCPAPEIAALAGIDGISWISLQKNPAQLPPSELNIVDLSGANENMEQTAAVISNLDLVVSIDTAVAHLAGALGKPTWTLLPYCPDWRWLIGRDDCPWYPTMRLFRQSQRKQWKPVLRAVAQELSTFRAPDT